MKAIVVHQFGPPSVMRYEDVPTPQPGPGEVLIEVHAVPVNRTLDCVGRAGLYSRPIPLPFIPGFDPSGVVVALGEGVTGRRVGDRVVAKLSLSDAGDPAGRSAGGYADYVCALASRTTVVPDALDFGTATVRQSAEAHQLVEARDSLGKVILEPTAT